MKRYVVPKNERFPKQSAAKSVLGKIGIDPKTRMDGLDQDFEYTSCSLSELDKYVELYEASDTTDDEKRVLGCYIFECLNEYVSVNELEHPLQKKAFEMLVSEPEIHQSELEYWSNTSDPNQENWWPITSYFIKWKNTHSKRM